MREYHQLIENVLRNGQYKPNRTGVDTISSFAENYTIDLQCGFPLLTTKDLSGSRWESLVQEFLWYLSGESHIKNLREHTSIWDAWADENGHLETAYPRFWRRYPFPVGFGREHGEAWPGHGGHAEIHEHPNSWETGFDQIGHIIDQLRENPNSRRIVLNAWHPANAAVSKLPPCHVMTVFNVQGDRLNAHLTQRSADVALGVPFNIASYALLIHVLAQQAGLEVGTFAHTLVDAHIYCGKGLRGGWYGSGNVRRYLWDILSGYGDPVGFGGPLAAKEWLEEKAPEEEEGEEGHDHVPGLLEQLSRGTRERPVIDVADVHVDDLEREHIELKGYDPHPPIDFEVAV